MNQRILQIEGELLLKNNERKRKAEAILTRPVAYDRLTVGIVSALVAGLGSYLLHGSSLPTEAGALFVGLLVGVVGLGMENWKMNRRLEAAIQLLMIHTAQQSKEQIEQ